MNAWKRKPSASADGLRRSSDKLIEEERAERKSVFMEKRSGAGVSNEVAEAV